MIQKNLKLTQNNLNKISYNSLADNMGEILSQVFRPKPKLTYLEYAESKFNIASGARRGPYYVSNAEYQRGILEAIQDNNEIVLKTSARVGKTLVQMLIMSFHIEEDPCEIMFVCPDDLFADDFASENVEKTIDANNGLRKVIPKDYSKSTRNTIRNKYWPTGSLRIVNAGNKNALSGKFIRVLLLDEVDKYPADSQGAGDPVNLAKERTQTPLDNQKIILASTPLNPDGRITIAYDNSSQGKYQIKCFHCDEFFIPKWEHVKWQETAEEHLTETALLHCPHCGSGHNDVERHQSVLKGQWIHSHPNRKVKGFHLNTIISPNVKLDSLVEKYVQSLGNPNLEQQFYNEVLGEVYEFQGQRFDDIVFDDRLEKYDTQSIPEGVLYLTAGTDVQLNYLETVVQGWGKDYETWNVDHFIVHGAPNDPATWESLHQELQKTYKREDGLKLKVKRAGIDTGGNFGKDEMGFSEYVRAFCKKYSRLGYMPFKGASTTQKSIFPTQMRKNWKVYLIDTVMAKDMIYKNLAVKQPGPSYMHYPLGRNNAFFDQLASEERIVEKTKNGRSTVRYQRIKGRDAEVLDCTVYALASMLSLGAKYESSALYINNNYKETLKNSPKVEESEEIQEKVEAENREVENDINTPITARKTGKYSNWHTTVISRI